MAKFNPVQFEALGIYIRAMIKDPAIMAVFKTGSQAEIKAILEGFMTPLGKSWDEITIVPHFDEENVVNISFPFTGDVEQTIAEIAPETGPGAAYPFPEHYKIDPNLGATDEERKANRLRAYHSRIGDYVMSRCK